MDDLRDTGLSQDEATEEGRISKGLTEREKKKEREREKKRERVREECERMHIPYRCWCERLREGGRPPHPACKAQTNSVHPVQASVQECSSCGRTPSGEEFQFFAHDGWTPTTTMSTITEAHLWKWKLNTQTMNG